MSGRAGPISIPVEILPCSQPFLLAQASVSITHPDRVDRLNARLVAELARKYGLGVEGLSDFSSPSSATDYLHAAATDTFHLGGGLAADVDDMGAVDQNLRLVGTDNVYVVSTAVLRRSGVVNPTTVVNNNTVSSTQVADARIEYRGTGYIDEAQTMGWLSRLFLTVLPF